MLDFARLREAVGTPTPTRRLDDADVIELAGRGVGRPPHARAHTGPPVPLRSRRPVCVLSGDHVLPTITPHISGLTTAADPLAQFFASLDRMHELSDVQGVLPAHGHPFVDLDGRVEAIKHHHEERLDRSAAASEELGPAGHGDGAGAHLFSPRAQGPMADSETYAHLEHLRLAGQAETRTVDGHLEYVVG